MDWKRIITWGLLLAVLTLAGWVSEAQAYLEEEYIIPGQEEQKSKSSATSHSGKPKAGDTWTDPTTGMEFVWVPGGSFQMGCGSWTSACDDDEKPVHTVNVKGFWMGKYEVTQVQWKKVMGSNPSKFKGGSNPVEEVSWNDVQEFIRKLNSRGSAKFRLPTEAEWEYACRSGGKKEEFSGGDDVDRVAWYGEGFDGKTHRVGTKAPNGLGLYDMSGNVWEWVEDKYHDSYNGAPSDGSAWLSGGGSRRVPRGGSWGLNPRNVRCADRSRYSPGDTGLNLGARLIRTK
jgi:formylglycine-generating enzyme required for sulfatase activity